jgi:hypothetical protein
MQTPQTLAALTYCPALVQGYGRQKEKRILPRFSFLLYFLHNDNAHITKLLYHFYQ